MKKKDKSSIGFSFRLRKSCAETKQPKILKHQLNDNNNHSDNQSEFCCQDYIFFKYNEFRNKIRLLEKYKFFKMLNLIHYSSFDPNFHKSKTPVGCHGGFSFGWYWISGW
jgi:hypothetical protein